LNKDGTLDNLTRALDDLLRSNTKPDSPADWLVDRLSIDYGNKLRKAQENFNEQLKENDKLRERLEKSRRFVQRLQEEIEDLTNKLEEEKGMAEAVATRAMLEPQELEMLKDELKEVMEDANEMADLIREYERREEERLALKSAKKELAKDKQDFRAQSPSSSDASSRGLPRFNEIQEKVRKQHSSAALADGDAHKKPPSPITASDSDYKQQQQQQQQQRVENDRVRKLIMSPSVRITESEGKMMF
jgi:methyl-accepting chemotaxis protein